MGSWARRRNGPRGLANRGLPFWSHRKDFCHYAAAILSYLLFCFSGNSYNIKNLRQTEAKLTFVQIKG